MKRVGGDSGRYEREEFVDGLILAPSERAVVDVCFDETGELTLEHRTPDRTYPLAMIRVADEHVEPSLTPEFEALRTNADMLAERARIAAHLEADPDKTLAFVAEMDMGEPELPPGATLAYACPMHPEVIGDVPGRCPKCGMALLATAAAPIAYACPMHPEVTSRSARALPGMRHEARARATRAAAGDHRQPRRMSTDHHHAASEHSPTPRRNRVGGRHGRRQPHHHAGEHALEARRPRRPARRGTRSIGASASATG